MRMSDWMELIGGNISVFQISDASVLFHLSYIKRNIDDLLFICSLSSTFVSQSCR